MTTTTTTKTAPAKPFSHYKHWYYKWCISYSKFHPKKATTLSHSNFEPIVSHFIGEYLLLIISIIIIYWFCIRKGKRKTCIHVVYKMLAQDQSFILNVNVQLTMELVRALQTNSSITWNCVCLFGWSLSIGIELRKEVIATVIK